MEAAVLSWAASQRKRLLAVYRKESSDPQVRLRAHIILLLVGRGAPGR